MLIVAVIQPCSAPGMLVVAVRSKEFAEVTRDA